MELSKLAIFGIAFLAGIIPALLWLRVWIHFDVNPEPRRMIFLAFILGALLVPLVVPLELVAERLLGSGIPLFIAIGSIEEVAKFLIIGILVFNSGHINEPIDYGIYLVTGALGFAAMENIMFLLKPLLAIDIPSALAVGNIRFLGATVLHAVCGGIIGIFMGTVYFNHRIIKFFATILGMSVAIGLHGLFNFFIMDITELPIMVPIVTLWVVGIVVISLFHRLVELSPVYYSEH